MKKFIIALCALGLFASCSKSNNEDEQAGRTVLIYMAAENNLDAPYYDLQGRRLQGILKALVSGTGTLV